MLSVRLFAIARPSPWPLFLVSLALPGVWVARDRSSRPDTPVVHAVLVDRSFDSHLQLKLALATIKRMTELLDRVVDTHEVASELRADRRAELVRNPNYVHGDFETVGLYSDEIVVLSQVRPGKNRALDDLKESILTSGLLNQLDVARVDRQLMEEYIAFTNRVWSSDRSIEEFDDLASDDYYYLLCAGHSRQQAIVELEEEGRLTEAYPIRSKLHAVVSIEDILRIQVEENTHTTPPIERQAMAVVEYYCWGLENGKWHDEDGFLRSEDGVEAKSGIVKDGLLFAKLPNDIRQFVFAKHIPYEAGVQLGQAGELYMRYLEFERGAALWTLPPEEQEIMQQTYSEWLAIRANHIFEHRLNSSASKKHLMSLQQQLKEKMKPKKDISQAEKDEMLFADFEEDIRKSSIAEVRRIQNENRRELRQLLQHYTTWPSESAYELLVLNGPFIAPEEYQKLLWGFKDSTRRAGEKLGSVAMANAFGGEGSLNEFT